MDAPIIALTPGEPAGIGPEILVKLIQENPALRLLVVADPVLLRDEIERQGHSLHINTWKPGAAIIAGALNCLPVSLARPVHPGIPDPANATVCLKHPAPGRTTDQ